MLWEALKEILTGLVTASQVTNELIAIGYQAGTETKRLKCIYPLAWPCDFEDLHSLLAPRRAGAGVSATVLTRLRLVRVPCMTWKRRLIGSAIDSTLSH